MWLYKVVCKDFTILCNNKRWEERSPTGCLKDSDEWAEETMELYLQRVKDSGADFEIVKITLQLENK